MRDTSPAHKARNADASPSANGPAARRRIGLLGGTFDPIHLGHLAVADFCRKRLALDVVRLVTARNPPHKDVSERTSAEHRHAMVALAAAAFPHLEALDIELRRRGPSYTVDTLREFRAQEPEADLFLLVGGDTIRELPTWHRLGEILRLATIVTVARPGAPADYRAESFPDLAAGEVARLNSFFIDMPPRAESSTEIRALVAAGKAFRHLVTPEVADYISRHGLYRGPTSSGIGTGVDAHPTAHTRPRCTRDR